MFYKFDIYGWFSGTSDGQVERSTDLAPTDFSETVTHGELRANFTGHEWLNLPYSLPQPSAPVVVVPDEVSMAQVRLALFKKGILTAVSAFVADMGGEAQIEFEYRVTVHRHNALVLAMQAQLGWTDGQVDEFFVFAGSL